MAREFRLNIVPEFRGRAGAMIQQVRVGITTVFVRRQIERQILSNIRARFAAQGTNPFAQRTPERRAWEPLIESTVRRRKTNQNPRQALVDSGSLRDSIRIKRANMVKALVSVRGESRIGPTRRTLGSNPLATTVEVAEIHQFGAEQIAKATFAGNPSGNLRRTVVARPFLGVGRKEGKQIEDIFDVAMTRALAGFGRP